VESNVDAVVVGAGLAGMSIAVALIDSGWKVMLIDQNKLGSGSSGVPIGLINPAAAKQANLSWNAKACISATGELLERTRPFSDRDFFKKSGVLRPSVDTATLEAFSTSLQRHNYPAGWAKWMDRTEIDTFHPGLNHSGGALWINEGYTVDVSSYLSALCRLLQTSGVEVVLEMSLQTVIWANNSHKWDLLLTNGRHIQATHVVNATGSSTIDDPDWKWLPVHKIKGQMAVYTSNEVLAWKHAIAGRGYTAHLNGYDWAVGSTFEHNYGDENPDEAGLKYLESKVDSMLPNLRTQSTLQSQWAGIRMGTPNRLPIVGEHPTQNGKWVFTGLGSKGLLLSAYVGQLLAANMIHSTELPFEISTMRFRSEST
jgi:glycine oxidase